MQANQKLFKLLILVKFIFVVSLKSELVAVVVVVGVTALGAQLVVLKVAPGHAFRNYYLWCSENLPYRIPGI